MSRPLTRDDLDPKRVGGITTQQYTKRASIDGVRLVDLKRFSEDGGSFAELVVLDQGRLRDIDGFEVVQVNYSDMEPGAVKAWHLHFKQEDVWFVPPYHKLLVGLYDVRRKSRSCGATMRLVLGDGRAQLLYIPRGVAHGVANLSDRRQVLIYFVNNRFSAEEPDEQRLDPFVLGREFWQIKAG
jgi:dTDP-4-dehydrorhamnose 3,5-epimerase